MKLSLEEIEQVLARKLDAQKADEVTKELQIVAEELKQEKDASKEPKAKNQYGIIVIDKNGEFVDKEITGYVYQIKEDDDITTCLTKVSNAARAFNETKKGKKHPVLSISDALSSLKRKFTKEQDINIKTKEPVLITFSNDELR